MKTSYKLVSVRFLKSHKGSFEIRHFVGPNLSRISYDVPLRDRESEPTAPQTRHPRGRTDRSRTPGFRHVPLPSYHSPRVGE